MPTYEYRCKLCEHEFELFQSMSDKPKRTCPECGKRGAERLISSGAGVLFKGSGFYETDYRSADYKKRAKEDRDSSKPSSDSSSSSSSSSKSSSKSD